jgi:CDP-glucose 4,6-dehydratase
MEMLVTSATWNQRRVFVTGHTGFKGGWLSLWLARMGARVRGYALDPPTTPCLFEAVRLNELVEDVRADVADKNSLCQSLREFSPEVVFHLAAQPLVRRSYADPIGTYTTNVMGTAHLLEAVRTVRSVRAVVVVTTDKCYENREWIWGYREQDPLGGYDPYSSSKACAEILTASYRNSFFSAENFVRHRVALATARAGNVIGGGDWSEDRLIPDLIRGFLAGTPVLIRYPEAVRPWQHVVEPLAGYLGIAEHLLEGNIQFADAWNFGPSDESTWTVRRIASAMASMWGNPASWVEDKAEKVHESVCLKLESSKARWKLGWAGRLPMDAALRWTVQWFQLWRQGADMLEETLRQIEEYEALLCQAASSVRGETL